jgi:hypothetical protein
MLTPERRREIEEAIAVLEPLRQNRTPGVWEYTDDHLQTEHTDIADIVWYGDSNPDVDGPLIVLAVNTPLEAMARELLEEVDRLTKERDAITNLMLGLDADERSADEDAVHWLAAIPDMRRGQTMEHYCETKGEAIAAVRKAAGLSEH